MIIRREDKYMPHNLIASLSGLMRDYQLPAGLVDMPLPETSAVVGILLYFLEKEPSIALTKLEYYMLLLDKMYLFDGIDEHILNWQQQMKSGRPNLKNFLLYMESRGLVKSGKYYEILKRGVVSAGYFPPKLKNWLDSISEKLRDAGVDETGRRVRGWIKERTMP